MNDELFDRLRPKGFAIAYRMLGSVSEAEDVVQEAFLRLYRDLEQGTEVESPEAYFVTVVTRLAIDELRSARARREVYTGEWLPEPILTAEEEDPARHAEIADSLSVGLLVVLETLTPEERAVFLLREVFDYPHNRIAEVLGKSPAAVRQLAVRARGHVGEREPRFETSREQHDRLAASFFDAFEEGDLEKLEATARRRRDAPRRRRRQGAGDREGDLRTCAGRAHDGRIPPTAERFGGVEHAGSS